MAIVLHQFEFSHFNDKARWALTWQGVERPAIRWAQEIYAKHRH